MTTWLGALKKGEVAMEHHLGGCRCLRLLLLCCVTSVWFGWYVSAVADRELRHTLGVRGIQSPSDVHAAGGIAVAVAVAAAVEGAESAEDFIVKKKHPSASNAGTFVAPLEETCGSIEEGTIP